MRWQDRMLEAGWGAVGWEPYSPYVRGWERGKWSILVGFKSVCLRYCVSDRYGPTVTLVEIIYTNGDPGPHEGILMLMAAPFENVTVAKLFGVNL